MAGETSEGMLLDVGYADGITPVLALLETPVPTVLARADRSFLRASRYPDGLSVRAGVASSILRS